MEVEAKFVVPDEETLQQLQVITTLDGYVLGPLRAQRVQDTYLDTAERHIWRAGYGLRRRARARGFLMTLKALYSEGEDLWRREELEILLLNEKPPRFWPTCEIRERLLSIIGDRPLMPLVELEQERITRPVRREGRHVATLSLDTVRLVRGGQHARFLNLELELEPEGEEEELQALTVLLSHRWGLKPELRSKFERALTFFDVDLPPQGDRLLNPCQRARLERVAAEASLYGRRARALLALDEGHTQLEAGGRAGMSARRVRHWLAAFRRKGLEIFPNRVLQATVAPPSDTRVPTAAKTLTLLLHPQREPPLPLLDPHPGLGPDDTMAEAARKLLLFHFQRILYHEPGTRAGEDPEALHDMRVATRKMRTAARIFAPYLDPHSLRPLLPEIRQVGNALGAVRDLDVFWQATEGYLIGLPEAHGSELVPLHAAWKAARTRARERMLGYLESEAYQQWKQRLAELLLVPWVDQERPLDRRGRARPRRVRHVAPILIYERLARVRAFDEWLQGTGVPLSRYHRLRIAGKGLRYTLQFFREVLGPTAEEALVDLEKLQDHLGALQDDVVALQLLRDFPDQGIWAPGESEAAPTPAIPEVTRYREARQRALKARREDFPALWQTYHSREFLAAIANSIIGL